jgi:ADP-ribose pyrophosphatase
VSASGRTLGSRTIHEGKVLRLVVDEVEEPGGVRAEREVVRHSGSVATLAVHDDGRIVLVKQYRHPVGDSLWELPAGRRDGDETPEKGAVRELEEEVGLTADALEPLATYYTTPGFCDEVMHLFRATRLRPVPARPDEDERIDVRSVPLEDALAMVQSGEIREGKTLVALLMESRRRSKQP